MEDEDVLWIFVQVFSRCSSSPTSIRLKKIYIMMIIWRTRSFCGDVLSCDPTRQCLSEGTDLSAQLKVKMLFSKSHNSTVIGPSLDGTTSGSRSVRWSPVSDLGSEELLIKTYTLKCS